MQKALIYILAMMMLLLMSACSSSDTTEEPQPVKERTMLTIYVYSPDKPLMTRGDVGPVDATAAESKVTQLQIWVFDKDANRVGALSTTETATLNGGEGAVYQIPVDDNFAKNKPNVDVYVLANVTVDNCGIATAFTETSIITDLQDKAKIMTGHYGLSPLTTTVHANGLPMAGVLRNQPVIGDAPVLRIGDQSHIATVPLTRAVSKLRFVFANTTGSAKLTITGITLKDGMIPNEEYLFPQGQSLTYNSSEASLLPSSVAEVAETDNPVDYVYNGQEAQVYENLINNAVNADQPQLSQVGPYYLRESDKRLEGTITYQVEGIDESMTASFRMKENGDFNRNHSWIVYAYYEGLSGMQVVTVDVTPWEERGGDHTVYNW